MGGRGRQLVYRASSRRAALSTDTLCTWLLAMSLVPGLTTMMLTMALLTIPIRTEKHALAHLTTHQMG